MSKYTDWLELSQHIPNLEPENYVNGAVLTPAIIHILGELVPNFITFRLGNFDADGKRYDAESRNVSLKIVPEHADAINAVLAGNPTDEQWDEFIDWAMAQYETKANACNVWESQV